MIYLELVPRSLEILLEEAKDSLSKYPELEGINIPDVIRLENRSYESSELLISQGIESIPHIRVIDNPIEKTVEIIEILKEKGLKRVLILTGDYPVDPKFNIHKVKPTQVVKALKAKLPSLKIYCALDPYRTNLQTEIDYCLEKCDAGADGFFTQPFFDLNLANIYLDKLRSTDLFIGISPVVTEKSLNYWITRNKVVFPSHFSIDLQHNINFAKELIKLSKDYNQHNYLMPIKAPVKEFLHGIFTK